MIMTEYILGTYYGLDKPLYIKSVDYIKDKVWVGIAKNEWKEFSLDLRDGWDIGFVYEGNWISFSEIDVNYIDSEEDLK